MKKLYDFVFKCLQFTFNALENHVKTKPDTRVIISTFHAFPLLTKLLVFSLKWKKSTFRCRYMYA